jgi:hypothetical protein
MILVSALVACALPTPVSPGRQSVGGVYEVETSVRWLRREESTRAQIWTSRGPTEDQLVFITGLIPGEGLIPGWERYGRYQAEMTPTEIAEFVVNSYRFHGGHTNAAVHRVWPSRFGDVDGFRFEYGYWTDVGVDVHGLGAGAVKDGQLYLIYFSAAGKRLFNELRPVVEQIIDSARFLETRDLGPLNAT